MAPIPPAPKVVVYHQTHHTRDGQRPISILPLLGRDDGAGSGRPSATHIVVAAVHINEPDSDKPLTLNDHAPDHPRFDVLWSEVATAQARGVRVLALLGGAAKGSYERLDIAREGAFPASFERHYALLHALLRRRRLDGVDLDVEEAMSLPGIVHLIDRLRADFGPAFLLTMAPVAAALLRPYDPRCNLSGFSYADLERQRGHEIAWYHAQFYCGWGDASQPHMYATMVGLGPPGTGLGGAGGPAGLFPQIPGTDVAGPIVWPAHRVVMGLVTNPANGPGFVPLDTSAEVMMQLQAATSAAAVAFPGVPGIRGGPFAGVSGWEYFNSMPGGEERPWEWAEWMSAILGTHVEADGLAGILQTATVTVTAAATATAGTTTNTTASTSTSTATAAATAAATTGTSTTASAMPSEADPDSEGGPDAPVPAAFEYTTDTEES